MNPHSCGNINTRIPVHEGETIKMIKTVGCWCLKQYICALIIPTKSAWMVYIWSNETYIFVPLMNHFIYFSIKILHISFKTIISIQTLIPIAKGIEGSKLSCNCYEISMVHSRFNLRRFLELEQERVQNLTRQRYSNYEIQQTFIPYLQWSTIKKQSMEDGQ